MYPDLLYSRLYHVISVVAMICTAGEVDSHLLGGDAPARVLLDGDCSSGAPGIEGGAGGLPLAQLGRLPEAAPREVPAHGCLDPDSCGVPLQSITQLSP